MADTFSTILADADDAILDSLGETVSIFDDTGTYLGNVVGVFDKQYIEAQNVQGFAPTFTYNDTEINIESGYSINYQAQDYVVRFLEPDGVGMTMLVLREQ